MHRAPGRMTTLQTALPGAAVLVHRMVSTLRVKPLFI
jgi:hypothetical protein